MAKSSQLARHPRSSKISKFFIDNLFEEFYSSWLEIRYYGEDKSVTKLVLENLKINSVLIIGQEKGEDLDSRIERNFGMMRPEGYRKTIRLMKLG